MLIKSWSNTIQKKVLESKKLLFRILEIFYSDPEVEFAITYLLYGRTVLLEVNMSVNEWCASENIPNVDI